jgi:hypothetical protein
MKKQIAVLLVAATCLSFVACKKELSTANKLASTGTLSNATATAANKMEEKDLPFKGEYVDAFEMLQPPPMFVQKVTGTGNATYMGNSTFAAIAHVDLTTAPPFAVTGVRTITAANGDQIFTTFSGVSFPVVPGLNKTELNEIITGGTGRFANASGNFKSSAIADQNNSIFTVSFDGRIVF